MDLKHRARRSRTSEISHNDKERGKEENTWSTMLDSVASGKKLPEKNILVLGPSTCVGRRTGLGLRIVCRGKSRWSEGVS